jgi:hypothetical protein
VWGDHAFRAAKRLEDTIAFGENAGDEALAFGDAFHFDRHRFDCLLQSSEPFVVDLRRTGGGASFGSDDESVPNDAGGDEHNDRWDEDRHHLRKVLYFRIHV